MVDLKQTSCTQLLDNFNTAPINATRLVSRINSARALKSKRTAKHGWTTSVEQEYFTRKRDYNNHKLTKLAGLDSKSKDPSETSAIIELNEGGQGAAAVTNSIDVDYECLNTSLSFSNDDPAMNNGDIDAIG